MTEAAIPYPEQVVRAAARRKLSPALAFGLGQGLNLFYTRRPELIPPHRIHILPTSFESRLDAALAQSTPQRFRTALVQGARAVLVCTGDWHGLDAIETWAEDLVRWPLTAGWETSLQQTAALIEKSDGLYRRSFRPFLALAAAELDGLGELGPLLDEIADGWLAIAAALTGPVGVERLGSRVLRMASLESRFWGEVLDRVGDGI